MGIDVMPEHSNGREREGLYVRYAYTVRDRWRCRCDPCHAYFPLSELVTGK